VKFGFVRSNPGEQDGAVLPMESSVDKLSTLAPNAEEDVDSEMYEKYDPLLHGKMRSRS